MARTVVRGFLPVLGLGLPAARADVAARGDESRAPFTPDGCPHHQPTGK